MMSDKSIKSEYYLELTAIEESKSHLALKIKTRGMETTRQFNFVSKGQWILLLAMYSICLLFLSFVCRWIT